MGHNIEDMIKIGEVDGYSIGIFGQEVGVPHFHFYKENGKKGGIQLLQNDYFYHADWNDELTDEEMKKLVDFLNTEVEFNIDNEYKIDTKFVKKLSNYEILCCNWDLIYLDNCYVTIGYMPNYLEM